MTDSGVLNCDACVLSLDSGVVLDSYCGSTVEMASRTCEVHCKQNWCEAIWSALTLEEQLADEN